MGYEKLNALKKPLVDEGIRMVEEFDGMTGRPMEIQESLLMKLLEENKDTEYGKRHGFGEIHSIEEFQKKVPVTGFDDYAEMIDRMADKGENNLLTEAAPVWYNKTSGTVGNPKKIPYTQDTRTVFDRYTRQYQNGILFKNIGEAYYGGRCLNLLHCSGSITKLSCGVPYGPISEATLEPLKPVWQLFFSNPMESVYAGAGTDTRYLNARYSLCDRELNSIICTFTGFLLDFCRYVEKNWKLLVRDIENGTIDASVELPDDLRRKLEANLAPMPERAAELRNVFEKGFDTPFMPAVWPELHYAAGGASAGFARYTKEVRQRYMGTDIAFYYRGISASEGVFTVPVGLARHDSCLIPDSLFYEFIPEDDENAEPVTMDKLEAGKRYELIITTNSGFYRYRINDVLLVTGFYNATPLVEFQYRIDKTVSLMGEKTTELALRTAAEGTAAECGFLLVDSSVYPDTDERRYVYIIEADRIPQDLTEERIAETLDKQLSKVNPGFYPDYLKNGLIKGAKVLFAQPETYVLYKDMMLMKGNSIAQLKPVTVIYNEMQRKFFFALTVDFDEVKTLCGAD